MIKLKPSQMQVFLSPRRFRLLVAGRRFGKTFLAQTELLRAAGGRGRVAWYVAPSYKQAKRIVWGPLKQLTRPYWASRPNETNLRIELAGGGTIAVRGADAYDSLRGEGIDFVVLDEYASMAPAAWHSVLRPMLADRLGEALFIGTPQGFNHFYDLYSDAEGRPGWAVFHFTTEQGGNVPQEELASAASEMDERLYRQEFRASFEELRSGRVYWGFDRTLAKPRAKPRGSVCKRETGRRCSKVFADSSNIVWGPKLDPLSTNATCQQEKTENIGDQGSADSVQHGHVEPVCSNWRNEVRSKNVRNV